MSDYFEIAITVENEDQKNQLVALLSDIGFEGFQEDNKILLAYAAVDDFDQVMMESILKTYNLSYLQSVIKPKNWNEEWEAGFEPVIIHDFCAIRASFHSPVAGVSHEIIITPKMSFGTGHHATTYMMIEAMSVLNFTGMKVLDFGTGTGVLAILASKMGAAVIEAVDYDEWSIENGRENIVRNNCSNISLYKSDSLFAVGKADIILANINKNIITQHLDAMKEHLLPGGVLLLSGLLADDLEDIEKLALLKSLVLKRVFERNSWICIHLASQYK